MARRRKSILEKGLPKRGKSRNPFATSRRRGSKRSMADAIAAKADFGRKGRRRRKGGDNWGFLKMFAKAERSYSAGDAITDRMTGRDEDRREAARIREQIMDERMTGLDMPPPINAQNQFSNDRDNPEGLTLWQRLVAAYRRLRGEA
jgi:hypothetical protein